MKIILSRKGFDDQYGKHPSIILPNGRMISFPIPVEKPETGVPLTEIFYEGYSLVELFASLGIKTDVNAQYHLDPDINKISKKNRHVNWAGAFGQAGAALGHLNAEEVGDNAVFLYYGTFNLTKKDQDGKLHYERSHPFHAIWGYLQVKKLIDNMDEIETDEGLAYLKDHPHYMNRNLNKYQKGNAIFLGKNWGTFKFTEKQRLTKMGYLKSYWSLPGFFKDIDLTYHKKEDYEYDPKTDSCLIQTAAKGQEFVMQANPQVIKWLNEILAVNEYPPIIDI
jgi:hypothetical protein